MSEENGAVEKTAGMVRPCNAWLIGILYGLLGGIFPLARMLGCTAIPEWVDDIPSGLLDIALGYYWAVILRNVTRDEKINPAVFAVFFGLCFAADLAVDVVYSSMRTTVSVMLDNGISVVMLAGIWYMVVRVWNAAAGRNAAFPAKFAVGYLALFSILVLANFAYVSTESAAWEPEDLAALFFIAAILYAGLQHLFNLGLRNSRIPEVPEDCRCPLWKAILQGGVVAVGIAIVIAVIVSVYFAANSPDGIQ